MAGLNKPSIVALIPARSGSKRVPDKNVRPLAGHPLMAYTITAALQSEIFEAVIVSTDSEDYAAIARHYGALTPCLRPSKLGGDLSPDFEWIEHMLTHLKKTGKEFDCFSILRPTSPFRLPRTILRAWEEFLAEKGVDSLRAVEKCKQHPGKMWAVRGKRMTPLLPFDLNGMPWHSNQYQALPPVYVQNASLEIAWSRLIFEDGTISGTVVMPFLTEGYEGFDVNHPRDWSEAEELVSGNADLLPRITLPPYPMKQHAALPRP